ncbi:MAG: DMT family transporter [Pseudomonadota bacterium]
MRSRLLIYMGLVLIAIIWGVGLVPLRLGVDYLGPAAFNALRFAFAAVTLVPVLALNHEIDRKVMLDRSTLLIAFVLGGLLFGGASFQLVSLRYTSLANVAFITAMYVTIVPAIGFFIGYKYRALIWAGVALAIVGLYLMADLDSALMLRGDVFALIGALFWAIHLLVLAKWAAGLNRLVLVFYSFVFCALISLLVATLAEESLLPGAPLGYLWPLLNGVVVIGLCYTLQVLMMEFAEVFAASMILSLFSVFAAIAGYFVFGEQLAMTAMLGAALILGGCLLAQWPKARAWQ